MSREIFNALLGLSDTTRQYGAGARVFGRGGRVNHVFLLESGELKLTRSLKEGTELILHQASGPCVLAEASVYSPAYHCDAICLTESTLRQIPRADFLQLLESNAALSASWSAYLAHGLQMSRFHSEVLRMKKVGDRVDAWLAITGNELPPKGQRKALAAQIGVSAEALYRELATRSRPTN